MSDHKEDLVEYIDASDLVVFSSNNEDLAVESLAVDDYSSKLSLDDWCEVHGNLSDVRDEDFDNRLAYCPRTYW